MRGGASTYGRGAPVLSKELISIRQAKVDWAPRDRADTSLAGKTYLIQTAVGELWI